MFSIEHLRGEFEEMIRNFAEAWELLRGDIGTFGKLRHISINNAGINIQYAHRKSSKIL